MIMTEWSGRFFWLAIMGILCMPLSVSAAEINFKSDTILRAFERSTATEKDAAVMPLYEYLRLDIDSPGEPGLAFHMYGWGRADLANNDYYSDDTEGELLYGYLEYSRKEARFNARLGRQQVFEGVANDAVDGVRFSSDLGRYFSGSLYAGQPVALNSESGSSGDSIYGGRLASHLASWYDLGLSYKKIRNDSDNAGEMTGIDLSAYLPYDVSLYGLSSYNLESEGWGEHSYELRLPLGPVALRPYFQEFQYEDYFSTGINSAGPFRYLADTGERLRVGGADLTLPVGKSWILVAKAKHYDYEIFDDSSRYSGAQATWSTGAGHSRIGGELGYMDGDTAQNDYTLFRLFSYWDQLPAGCPIGFISGDLLFVGYDQAIYGEDSSLFISLGVGKKFLADTLELKLSADYSRDPYFDHDLRGMLTASYRFGKTL
ncbi:MAG: hypothetical protein K0A99_06480 [Desulfoarculaceae bacterium]|nr:hypothetical protein [Desulfoarculaceae bacterium]